MLRDDAQSHREMRAALTQYENASGEMRHAIAVSDVERHLTRGGVGSIDHAIQSLADAQDRYEGVLEAGRSRATHRD